jgi:hypothetical protein
VVTAVELVVVVVLLDQLFVVVVFVQPVYQLVHYQSTKSKQTILSS